MTPIYLAMNIGTFIGSRKLSAAPTPVGMTPPLPGAGRSVTAGYGPQDNPAFTPQAPQPLRLRDERTGNTVNLAEGVTLGRSPQRARIVIDDPQISGLHARVVRVGNILVLEDAGSSNGILVNGQPSSRSPLTPGMRIQLGGTQLTVLSRT